MNPNDVLSQIKQVMKEDDYTQMDIQNEKGINQGNLSRAFKNQNIGLILLCKIVEAINCEIKIVRLQK